MLQLAVTLIASLSAPSTQMSLVTTHATNGQLSTELMTQQIKKTQPKVTTESITTESS